MVAEKLSKALGVTMTAWPPNQRNSKRFTLHAQEKPFWEVFKALANQSNLSFMSNPQELQLMSNSGDNPMTRCEIYGPVLVVPQSVTRQRTANFQAPAGREAQPETMSISCNIMLDPRLRLAQYKGAQFTEIVDDVGNVLFKQEADKSYFMGREHFVVQSIGAGLKIPANPGKKIASAKGQVAFSVATAVEKIIVESPEKKKGDTFQVAGLSMKLSQFDLQDNSLNIGFQRDSAANILGIRGPEADKAIDVEVLDANNKVIASTSVHSGFSSWGTSGSRIAAPVKMRLSAPTKTKDVTIQFELKDLPLP